MSWQIWLQGFAGAALAMLVASLLEYAVHRLMHRGKTLGKRHAQHHRDGEGQGWLGEFRDYVLPAVPVFGLSLLVAYLFGFPALGYGILAGGTLFAMVAAYAHQIQHERPELMFWLPQPVHYLHHHHKMWHHNFGITVDVWDRAFGTYKESEWEPERGVFRQPLADFVRIKWF